MAILFLAIIFAILLIAYFVGNKDLLSPWFLLCLAIFATYAIVLLNYTNWEVNINVTFIVYVTTAIVAFGAGCLLIKGVRPLPVEAKINGLNRVRVDDVNLRKRYPANLFIIISIVFAVLYVYRLLTDAAGDADSLSGKIRAIYDKIVEEDYSPGFIYNQLMEVVTAIAYINTFRLFIRLFSKDDKISRIKLIIPIMAFLIAIVFSSDRNKFIRYAFYAICLFVLFYRENTKKKNINASIVRIVIILLLVMIILFFLMGSLKQYKSNIFKSLSIYGGSGLYNFNLWLENFDGKLSYGSVTFSTFLNTFNAFLKPFDMGLDLPEYARFDAFITYTAQNGYVYSSNIYSSLKPYVEDFGYFGMILFPFVMGVFYQLLFSTMKKRKYEFGWVLYCLLIYPIVFFPIAEQLFFRLHLGMVYEIGWCAILYFTVFGRKNKNRQAIQIAKIEGQHNE